MKIVRYEQGWQAHWGILDGSAVHKVGGDVFTDARPGPVVGSVDTLRLLAPCAPRTIWSNGSNYLSRCAEHGGAPPTEPSFLWCPGAMICGPEAEIRIPEFERRTEYGAELGVVVRSDCYEIALAAADEYILGYTQLNNVWTKDPAGVTSERPLRVYDTYCPVGPILDTDFDCRDRSIRLSVDDGQRQNDRTSSMLFSPRQLIFALSQLVPLKQGDLIMTGSPGGIEGHTLHYGEAVTVAIEGLGILRNRVVRVDNATTTSIVSVKAWLRQREGQDYVHAASGSRGGGK